MAVVDGEVATDDIAVLPHALLELLLEDRPLRAVDDIADAQGSQGPRLRGPCEQRRCEGGPEQVSARQDRRPGRVHSITSSARAGSKVGDAGPAVGVGLGTGRQQADPARPPPGVGEAGQRQAGERGSARREIT